MGECIELARPALVGVPLAGEQSLLLQAPQQRVERVALHLDAGPGEVLLQRVSVARLTQARQRREDDSPPPQLLAVGGQRLMLGHVSDISVCHTVKSMTRRCPGNHRLSLTSLPGPLSTPTTQSSMGAVSSPANTRSTQMTLDGKVALVTGAATGIGRAVAIAYANAGAKVVVSDIDDTRGQETVDQITGAGGEATYFHCDTSSAEQNDALVDHAK